MTQGIVVGGLSGFAAAGAATGVGMAFGYGYAATMAAGTLSGAVGNFTPTPTSSAPTSGGSASGRTIKVAARMQNGGRRHSRSVMAAKMLN